jgi:hypothetical protein
MANVSSPSDIQNAIPVRPASPIAQRQQSEQQQIAQEQFVNGGNQARQTNDQEVERAVRAFERDRNEKQRFISEGTQETVLENYIEQYDPTGYQASGASASSAGNNAAGRGQVVDFYA